MYLVRLVYTSMVSGDFGPDDLQQILGSARRNNKKKNVTGMLCFNQQCFLQCLEGSRAAVNDIYHSILNDSRHSKILILSYTEVIERQFDSWSMGYVPESSLTAPLNLKYSGTPEFDPYSMSGESTYKLLLSLREHIPVV